MERRLEDTLSRIAMETQEIEELEQQLTDSQILANEALRKDLEGIISGLQKYFKSLRAQTSQTQQKVQCLQVENLSLRRHLEDTHRCCRQLEEQATAHTQDDCHHKELHRLNRKLQELRRVMCECDTVSGDQLLWAVDQLQDLNSSLDCLKAVAQSDDSKLSEMRPEMDPIRTKSGSKPRSRTENRSMTKARERRDRESCLKDPSSVSVGSWATQDSGLGLHLLSSPEKVPPTGATGNCFYIPTMKEHHQQYTETNPSEEDSGTLHCATVGPAEGAHRQDRLRLETEKLQRTLRKHRRVLGVCEEVWCVEQTLMKRRAELREAQRLLQEAHSSIGQAQCETEEWERRAKDSATCLQQTQLQLKELQDEVETLRKSRQVQILNQSSDLDLVWSRRLDSSDQLASLKSQEERLQQRTEELRDQETRLRTTLQSLVQQQEALLSQRSSLVSATAEEEQRLEHLQSELDSTRTELKQVQEELLSERQELLNLKTLQSKELEKLQKTQLQLDQTRTELDHTQDLLDRTKDQADRIKTELNQAKDQLDQIESELLMKREEVRQKEEELDQSQAAVHGKRAELMELQQEVEMRGKEAESCLNETEQQTRELQEVKEEVEQRKEQSSSLQQQCRHLEDRRRHAHRCLSAVEAELHKLKQEQSQSLLTQQEAVQEAAANQEKLNESSELLSLLGEKVEERKVQLQTLEQELCALREKHKHTQRELQELEHRAHTQALTAVTESEDRGCRVTQEQLHKLSEELREREKRLLRREAELMRKEEELHLKEAGLTLEEKDLLPKEEELPSGLDDSVEESSEEFYLSTAGLRSASSPEEERWRVEVETDKLQLKQDSLRARLRRSLRSQDQSLQERDLQTEQSLRGLRHSVDRLDGLLHRAKTHT